MDTQRIGQLAAEFLEQVEEKHGEDAEVEDAIIVPAITVPDGEGGSYQHISIRSTTKSRVVQTGLLAWGDDMVMGDFDDEEPDVG